MAVTIGYRDQVAPPPRRGALRDIRRYIALTPQTDSTKFERVEYRRYPLMPKDDNGQHFKDAAGRFIVLRDAADEDAFYADHPHLERHQDPVDAANELARLREENKRLRAKHAGPADEPADDKPVKEAAPTKGLSGLVKPSGKTAPKTRAADVGPAPGSKLD
jgi:hypothetical protein